jgi:DNA-binding PadR family transcriptional regulator
MSRDAPSRVGLLQGTLDLLILRTLLAGSAHGHQIAKHIQRTSEDLFYRLTPLGRKPLAAERSKWQAFARAVALSLNPVDQEAQ